MTDLSPVQSAAAILADRQQSHVAGPRLPESCRPSDLAAALAVQEETARLLAGRQATGIGGWKCGTPGPDKLVVAPILDDCIWRAPSCPARPLDGKLRIEPELAFILARDLPAREEAYAPEEVDDAIGEVRLALELIASRYAQPAEVPFAEHLADRLLNQGLYLGPPVDAGLARGAGSFDIRVAAGGDEQSFDGRHPDGNPLLPLYWLAQFLRERGRGLRAGEAVITGSYVPSFEVPAGQDVSVRFGTLGVLKVRFDR